MSNLPASGQPASMDALTVTREEFRLGMNSLLEYLAQALGGVAGTYGTQAVDPLQLALQGEPKLAAGAVPAPDDDSLRLVSSAWVQALLGEFGEGFLTAAGGTLTGNLTVPSLNGGPLAGMRNRIINGHFMFDQRGGGNPFALPLPAVYGPDRWYAQMTGAGVTGQRVVLANPIRYGWRISGAAGNTSLDIGQRIEQFNAISLAGRKATFQIEIASTAYTSATLSFNTPNVGDVWTTKTDFASVPITGISTTSKRFTATIDVPDSATRGLEVQIRFASGLPAGQTVTFSNAQLEPGEVATPIERRDLTTEQMLCHRYYWVGMTVATLNAISTTANVSVSAVFPVPMRVNPSIVCGYPLSFVNGYNATFYANVPGLSWAAPQAIAANAEL